MKKVLVIGGSGFIGSHTADMLSSKGYSVTIFDRVKSPWLRPDQEMIIGDILDRDSVENAMNGIEYVYHYAGIADIGEASERPFDTIQLNIIGATIAIETAIKEKVKRFVYASTMYVYSPYGSFYRASKQAVETILEAYCERSDIEYTFLRYGSLYGPRSQSWNGIRKYIKQVISEGKLNYAGTGKERREYIHVIDAARLSVDILDQEHRNSAITVTGSQILNSSELISMIFEITGRKENVVFDASHVENDHYTMTPYRYTPQTAKKLVPGEFIDVGQGILELVEEISRESGNS